MKISNYLKLARLNQPTGIWLLFLPCLFGIFLAIKKLPEPNFAEVFRLVFLFFIGSVVMRSAGCLINDLFDQKFDKKVERTKNRPLASGKVSRISAFIFLICLSLVGLLILLQFNRATILSGFFAVILIIAYPAMKRITYYPQIFLGLTFNFGVLMAHLAILNYIDFDAAALYSACIIWTVIYDTIYAYQDIEDDLRVGVKSTAIRFGKNPKNILISLNLAMFLILIGMARCANLDYSFYLGALAASLILDHKIKNCDFANSQNCLAVFKFNIWIGALILIAIISG